MTVYPQVGLSCLKVLFIIGLSAHVYGFVLNEVVDVKVDAKASALSEKPLVKESIGRGRALAVAVFQIPFLVLLGILFFGADAVSLTILFSSILLATVYDLKGKRFPFCPILADIVLGLSISLLYLYGVVVVQLDVNQCLDLAALNLPLLLACPPGLHLIFMNSVTGGLKDLDHDLLGGAQTTVNWLGANLTGANQLYIPRALKIYALGLEGLWLLLLALPVPLGWLFYTAAELTTTVIVLIGLSVVVFATVARCLRSWSTFDRERLKRLFFQHEILAYWAFPILLWFYLGAARASAMMLLPVIWYVACNLALYGRPLPPTV